MHQLDTSARSVARRGLVALVLAAGVELGIVAIANTADWPAGAFYTVSALALCIVAVFAVPIIEPPRPVTPEDTSEAIDESLVATVVAEDRERREAAKADVRTAKRPRLQDAYGGSGYADDLAGIYRCTTCGYELQVGSAERLPPCPSCYSAEWEALQPRAVEWRDVTDDG